MTIPTNGQRKFLAVVRPGWGRIDLEGCDADPDFAFGSCAARRPRARIEP